VSIPAKDRRAMARSGAVDCFFLSRVLKPQVITPWHPSYKQVSQREKKSLQKAGEKISQKMKEKL